MIRRCRTFLSTRKIVHLSFSLDPFTSYNVSNVGVLFLYIVSENSTLCFFMCAGCGACSSDSINLCCTNSIACSWPSSFASNRESCILLLFPMPLIHSRLDYELRWPRWTRPRSTLQRNCLSWIPLELQLVAAAPSLRWTRTLTLRSSNGRIGRNRVV